MSQTKWLGVNERKKIQGVFLKSESRFKKSMYPDSLHKKEMEVLANQSPNKPFGKMKSLIEYATNNSCRGLSEALSKRDPRKSEAALVLCWLVQFSFILLKWRIFQKRTGATAFFSSFEAGLLFIRLSLYGRTAESSFSVLSIYVGGNRWWVQFTTWTLWKFVDPSVRTRFEGISLVLMKDMNGAFLIYLVLAGRGRT